MDTLALFPDLGGYGGVQASGKAALEALRDASVGRGLIHAISYSGQFRSEVEATQVDGRGRCFVRVLRTPADRVLVWHLGLVPVVLGCPRRSRISLYLHGIEAWRPLGFLKRLAFRRVGLVLTNSAYTWSRFAEANPWAGQKEHVVVPLGLGDVSREIEPPDTQPTAVIIGRLDRNEDYKGHRELISAWPLVRKHVAGAVLRVIGSGDLEPSLREHASQRAVEGVEFVGSLPPEMKGRELVRSRCLLMPSRNEGFGLVYLEAMRLGRPCLVSDRDAGREVVVPPECGLSADPSDESALVEAIARLMTMSSEWSEWSRRASLRYARMYTARCFSDRLVSALDGVGAARRA